MTQGKHILPNLTPLRFFLAFLTMLFHIPQFCQKRGFLYYDELPIFHKGQEAVFVFFSLSGFLIIRQLFAEKELSGTISLKNFYLRRVLRIFPLYYLVLFFGFMYYQLILPKLGFAYDNNYNLWEAIILGITFFANILATYSPGGIIEILWSIGIEEQFYLFVAPVICLLPTKRIFLFMSAFTIIYFLLFNISGISILHKYQMYYYFFATSGLFAIISLKYKSFRAPCIVRYLLIGTFVFYFTTSFFKDCLPNTVYQFFSMILFSAVIYVLSQKRISILDNRPLRYLGKISYGIYVYHAIAMQFMGLIYLKIGIISNWPSAINIFLFYLLVFVITILLSHFSYRYYESYFLNLKRRFRIISN